MNKKYEVGSILIEALISLVVASIIGVGIAYAILKTASNQATMNAQGVTVKSIRKLMQDGSCPSSSTSVNLASGGSPPTASVTCSQTTLNYTISSNLSGVVTTTTGSFSLPNYQATSTNVAMNGTLNVKASQQ